MHRAKKQMKEKHTAQRREKKKPDKQIEKVFFCVPMCFEQ